MQEEVLDRDITAARLRPVHARRACICKDPLIPELGQVPRNGIVELERSLLPQNHGGQAGNGPGHRIEPEDGVLRHRASGFDVRLSQRLHVDQSTASHHGADDAGDMSGVDVGLKRVGHSAEPRAREPDGLGCGGRKALSLCGGRATYGQDAQQEGCKEGAAAGADEDTQAGRLVLHHRDMVVWVSIPQLQGLRGSPTRAASRLPGRRRWSTSTNIPEKQFPCDFFDLIAALK